MQQPFISSQLPALRPVENRLWERKGIWGWWLDLTAPARPPSGAPIGLIEQVRKAELTSYSILAIFVCLIALISNSLADPGTAWAGARSRSRG